MRGSEQARAAAPESELEASAQEAKAPRIATGNRPRTLNGVSSAQAGRQAGSVQREEKNKARAGRQRRYES